jgi:hypothetical protein
MEDLRSKRGAEAFLDSTGEVVVVADAVKALWKNEFYGKRSMAAVTAFILLVTNTLHHPGSLNIMRIPMVQMMEEVMEGTAQVGYLTNWAHRVAGIVAMCLFA